jgi:hypothetical protein
MTLFIYESVMLYSKGLGSLFVWGATTSSITTFSIMTLSIKGLFVTLSVNDIQKK